MNHIKKFNQINENSDSSFLLKMNPRIDQLIEYLHDYKEKINNSESEDDTYSENEKVDKIWADVFFPERKWLKKD